jgi:tellurite resistance protein
VGNILVPVSGVPLGFVEISWFFFAVGLLFWIVMLSILMNRFFFHSPMASKLLPTLFILIAPPAVGFIAWTRLHKGVLDDMGKMLYYAALFTTLLLLFQVRAFMKVKFALPWWAYSFPTASITIATTLMLEKVGGLFFAVLTPLLLVFLSIMVLVLVYNTLVAGWRGEICVPEG